MQKFSSKGDYLTHISSYGSNNGEMKCPHGLIVHNRNNMLQTSVTIASQFFLSVVLYIPKGYNGIGRLGDPYDVEVTSNDELPVADKKHNCR